MFILAAERARARLIEQGLIPEKQFTDEERQEQQALAEQQANQPPQEDPNMVLARAEEGKAQAAQMNAQTKQQVEGANAQNKQQELQIEMAKVQLQQQQFEREGNAKFNVEAAKIDQGQQKIDQDQQKIDNNTQLQQMQLLMKQQESMAKEIKTNAESFKIMAEAMQTFVGPGIVEAGIKQAEVIQESQEDAKGGAELPSDIET